MISERKRNVAYQTYRAFTFSQRNCDGIGTSRVVAGPKGYRHTETHVYYMDAVLPCCLMGLSILMSNKILLLIPEPTSASAAKSVTRAERRAARWSPLAAASQAREANSSTTARHRSTPTGKLIYFKRLLAMSQLQNRTTPLTKV